MVLPTIAHISLKENIMQVHNKELFENMNIKKAVLALALPTVLSQLVSVIYNMADTFFIGKLNDPAQVAATTLAMPVFAVLTGIANLFGIGGASLVSRSLGENDTHKAKKCVSFCIFSCIGVAFLYSLVMYFFRSGIIYAIGADSSTYIYCEEYIIRTIVIGGIPTALASTLAHLLRSEGFAKEAGFGISMGGILNIILDPIFIFTFDLQISGAASATALSNVITLVYFCFVIKKNKKKSIISFDIRNYSLSGSIPKEIILVGFPATLMNIMSIFSNIILHRLLSIYSTEAIAGMGIAKKIDLIAFAVANGISQGVLPLVGYNYAAKNYRRMAESLKVTFLYSFGISLVSTVFLFVFSVPVSSAFISDEQTVMYAHEFLRIICTTCPCVSVTMISITTLQATGKKFWPMVLSFLRKGGVDIPAMLIMQSLMGINGIAWASPIADVAAMAVSAVMFGLFMKNTNKMLKEESGKYEQC